MKNLFIIAAAVAAMAACTKNSVVYDDSQNEIGFIPVPDVVGKANVHGPIGTDGTGNTGTYPTNETFGVFAYHTTTQGAGTAWNTFHGGQTPSKYINNGEFVWHADLNSFAGATPYYWPKTGSLAFAGYSPYADLKDKVDYAPEQTAPALTITDFEQGTYKWVHDATAVTNETIDVMWFDVNDQNSTSQNDVPVVFKHALTWIDFKLKEAESTPDNMFTIKKVTLTNIYPGGDFTSATDTWTPNGTLTDIVLFYNDATGTNLTADAVLDLGKLLIVPQAVGGNKPNSAKSQIVIEYTQNTSASEPLTETITRDLTASDVSGIQTWELGKHYTYNISFSLNEIEITATVADWDVANGGDITVGGNN